MPVQEDQLSNPPPRDPPGPRVALFSEKLSLSPGGRDPRGAVGGRIPEFGDIVSCFFPEDDRPNHPGIKARPCVVLACERYDQTVLKWCEGYEQGDMWWVKVAYGTTQRPDDIQPGQFSISTPESLKAAGLHHPTRFMTNNPRIVDFKFYYFRANRDGSVFLGALSPEDRVRAQQAIEAGAGQRLRPDE